MHRVPYTSLSIKDYLTCCARCNRDVIDAALQSRRCLRYIIARVATGRKAPEEEGGIVPKIAIHGPRGWGCRMDKYLTREDSLTTLCNVGFVQHHCHFKSENQVPTPLSHQTRPEHNSSELGDSVILSIILIANGTPH
jgi:hypothetical protein